MKKALEIRDDNHLEAQAKGVMFQFRPFIKDKNFGLDEVLRMVTKPLANSYKRERDLKWAITDALLLFESGYPDQAEERLRTTINKLTLPVS